MEKIVLTNEGLEKIRLELKELKNVRRPEVRQRINTAKEFGDLSENAEYEAARNEQSFIEGRIQELEEMIKNAQVVSKESGRASISVGSTIKIDCSGEISEYEIVGANESDPNQGKISSESPIAKAILGKKQGEKVLINTPGGETECRILEIR